MTEIAVIGVGRGIHEKAVVNPDFSFDRVGTTDPVNIALYLVGGTPFRSTLAIRKIIAMDGSDITGFILIVTGTFDDVTITQTNAIAREQAKITLFRIDHDIFTLNPQFFGNREAAQAPFRIMRVNR